MKIQSSKDNTSIFGPLIVPEYLTTVQAASFLAVSRQFLEISRCKGGGPPFIKLARLVRYRKCDLNGWMESHIKSNTVDLENE